MPNRPIDLVAHMLGINISNGYIYKYIFIESIIYVTNIIHNIHKHIYNRAQSSALGYKINKSMFSAL